MSPLRPWSTMRATRAVPFAGSVSRAFLYAAMAWSTLPAMSKSRPTAMLANELRGFRKTPCWAWAMASFQFAWGFWAARARPRAANASPDLGSSSLAFLASATASAALPSRARERARPTRGRCVFASSSRAFWYAAVASPYLARATRASPRASWATALEAPAATALSALARAATPSLARASARARAARETGEALAFTASSAFARASLLEPRSSSKLAAAASASDFIPASPRAADTARLAVAAASSRLPAFSWMRARARNASAVFAPSANFCIPFRASSGLPFWICSSALATAASSFWSAAR